MLPVVVAPFVRDGAAHVLEQHLHMIGVGVAQVHFVAFIQEMPGILQIVLLEDVYHLLKIFHGVEDHLFQSRPLVVISVIPVLYYPADVPVEAGAEVSLAAGFSGFGLPFVAAAGVVFDFL
jgi:hypothetical protein